MQAKSFATTLAVLQNMIKYLWMNWQQQCIQDILGISQIYNFSLEKWEKIPHQNLKDLRLRTKEISKYCTDEESTFKN